MSTVTKAKAMVYIVLVPIIIGTAIFITIAGAIGIINVPFLSRNTPEKQNEQLIETIEKHEQTIASLRRVIDNQKDEIAKIKSEYQSKEQSLISKEQSLMDLEDSLNDRELKIVAEEERLDSLAKNFSQMRAKDAANILTHLENEEILKIFQHMTSQKVSEILSAFDSERAASLAQAMM